MVQSAKKERLRPMSAASTMSDVMAPWTSASQVMGVPSSLRIELAAQGMMPSSCWSSFQHWMQPAVQWYFLSRRRMATAMAATVCVCSVVQSRS